MNLNDLSLDTSAALNMAPGLNIRPDTDMTASDSFMHPNARSSLVGAFSACSLLFLLSKPNKHDRVEFKTVSFKHNVKT